MKQWALAAGLAGSVLYGILAFGAASPAAAQLTCPAGAPQVTVTSNPSDAGYAMKGVSFCGSTMSYNSSSLEAYQGIRYATADRWQLPAAYNYTAAATNPALDYGSACPRLGAPGEGTPGTGIGISEDCLSLNVWRPAGTAANAGLPVMVFIHGGAFVFGSSSDGVEVYHSKVNPDSGTYNGKALASHGLIVVTINYRLGALGFVSASFADSMNRTVKIEANLGLRDQQLALKWVRDNIASLGGNPGNVTLFGESAGAMSTGFHMFSIPSSDSLFAAAIMESNPMGYPYRNQGAGLRDGQDFISCVCQVANNQVEKGKSCKTAKESSCKIDYPTLQAQSSTSTAVVMAAQAAYAGELVGAEMASHLPESLQFSPVIDGDLVKVQPLGFDGAFPNAPKPYVFGMNKDEGALFPSLAIAAGKSISKDAYGLIMDEVFKGDSRKIRDYKPSGGGLKPYAADSRFDMKTMGDPYIAMSNTINDFAFRCGNYYSAIKATTDSRRTADAPVYGYLFEPDAIPYTVMPVKNPACGPNNADGFVCHTSELPFVFDSLTSAYADPVTMTRYQPTADVTALSEKVVAAWAAFAKGGSPRSPATADFAWQAWKAGGNTTVQRISASPAMVDPFADSNCGADTESGDLWFSILKDPPGTD